MDIGCAAAAVDDTSRVVLSYPLPEIQSFVALSFAVFTGSQDVISFQDQCSASCS